MYKKNTYIYICVCIYIYIYIYISVSNHLRPSDMIASLDRSTRQASPSICSYEYQTKGP